MRHKTIFFSLAFSKGKVSGGGRDESEVSRGEGSARLVQARGSTQIFAALVQLLQRPLEAARLSGKMRLNVPSIQEKKKEKEQEKFFKKKKKEGREA